MATKIFLNCDWTFSRSIQSNYPTIRLLIAKTIPHLLTSLVGKVFKLGAGVNATFLGVVVATGTVVFVIGPKVKPVDDGLKSEPEEEPVDGGFGAVDREEN